MQHLVTKKQLENFYQSLESNAKVPTFKKKTIIAFPMTGEYQFNTVIIEKTMFKSTDGKVLYSMNFQNN
jgi:hypothetical protein